MKRVFLFIALGLLITLFASARITPVSAAPKSVCVSTTAGGDWAFPATWQFCTSGTVPDTTFDVYIQGPVITGLRTTANVSISSGGSLDTTSATLTAKNVTIDAGGWLTGTLDTVAANGNLTNGGSSNIGGVIGGSLTNDGTFTLKSALQINGSLTNNASGTLSLANNTLTLYGNLTNDGTFNSNTGTVIFETASAQTIGGANAITFSTLEIINSAGVSLNKNATVTDTLKLTLGDLNTGANILSLASAATVQAAGGDVVGNVQRTHAFATATNYAFNNPNTLVNFSSLASAPTSITINLAKSAPAGFTRTLPRTYTISAAGSPSFNGTLQLHYAAGEVAPAGLTEANMRAWKQVNGRWVLQTGSVTIGGTNPYVSATNVTGFSLWAISDMGTPTAVTLSSLYTNSTENSSGLIMIVGLAMVAITGLTQVWLRKR